MSMLMELRMCRPALQVIVFLDTEFTALVEHPSLLSIGLVTSDGDEFYAEVVDDARLRASSPFTSMVVIPQLGKVPCAACDDGELGARLADFLDGLTSTLAAGESMSVAYESDRDWALLERAVTRDHPERWTRLNAVLKPVNVSNMPGFDAGARAARRYSDAQHGALFSRHHALCDARALRIAYDAATASVAHHAMTVAAATEQCRHRGSADWRHLAASR